MMKVDFSDFAAIHRHSVVDDALDPARLLADDRANDSLASCRTTSISGLSLLVRRYGIQGYVTSVHTACASGGQAIGAALKPIRRGAADHVLAGGFDSMINPIGLSGFGLLSALSPDNATPHRASRPFDATRTRRRRRDGR